MLRKTGKGLISHDLYSVEIILMQRFLMGLGIFEGVCDSSFGGFHEAQRVFSILEGKLKLHRDVSHHSCEDKDKGPNS